MGYDDNTPLTGVTGGGLPAEIWHEVMARVHEGVPVSPLPMDIPEPRLPPQPQYQDPQFPEGQAPQGQQPRRDRSQEDPVESLLKDLLGLY